MDSPAFSGKRRTALPPLLSWIRVVSALGLLIYALFLAHYMGAYAGGSDQSGYLNNARLLEQGRVITPMRVRPLVVASASRNEPGVFGTLASSSAGMS